MSEATNTNTILLHATGGVRAIDERILAVDVPGGTLTLIFASRNTMRHAACVIIAATDPSEPETIDEVAVSFQDTCSVGEFIPRIPANGAPADGAPDESEESEEEDDLPNLNDSADTDETEYIEGDIGLTQELNF